MPEDSQRFEWSSSRGFAIAPTGYLPVDVHRLLRDLEQAEKSGAELGPIIEARTLTEVGFGYDTAEVNAFLDALRGIAKSRVTRVPDPTRTPLPAHGQALYPPRKDGEDQLSAETTTTLQAIESARYLPPSQQFQDGYDAREVDRFFAGLSFAARANVSIVDDVRRARFPIAKRAIKAYDVAAVDDLVDRVEMLACAIDSAGGSRPSTPSERGERKAMAWPQVGLGFAVLGIVVALGALVVVLLS
ncbi:MAG: hypothetical protein Q4P15_11330 [Propionibacteriaceae bacterium]|nr:hypothetical protein [Propionibacteriaceae bacterium]